MTPIEKAIFILQNTNDGDDLSPGHLHLVESAVNRILTDAGIEAFENVFQAVKNGNYTKPWFHGVEHFTTDHAGYVYYKGISIEHFSGHYRYSDEAKQAVLELKRRCEILEAAGKPVSCEAVIWRWKE